MEITINIEKIEVEIEDVTMTDGSSMKKEYELEREKEEDTGENVKEVSVNPYKYHAVKDAMEELGDIEQAVVYDNSSADFDKVKLVTFLNKDAIEILEKIALEENISLSQVLENMLIDYNLVCDEDPDEEARIEEAYDRAADIQFPHPEEEFCVDGFCELVKEADKQNF